MKVHRCSLCHKKILTREYEREYNGLYFCFFPCWMKYYARIKDKENKR